MKLLYVQLIGYVGIYNGLGKKEIEIDFTRCRNKICVISGPNGCGKSTLLNSLSVLPDSRDLLVPSMSAGKKLSLLDQDIRYDIYIMYPIDGSGNRTQTKAYIQKNGVELNQNGNVTSYKEIIFNEFDLDSNYITLSHLSGDDRGLADKKPAERKKFVASISSSLDAYNDIYKNLNKKANTYKSYITNLTGKIKAIGDEANLRSGLVSLVNRENSLTEKIEKLKTNIIQDQTVIQVNDPDGKLQERYSIIEKDFNAAIRTTADAFSRFRSYLENHFDSKSNNISTIKIQEIISTTTTFTEAKINEIEDLKSQVEFHKNKKNDNNANILVLNNIIQTNYDRIEAINVKLEKLEKDVDYKLDDMVESYKNQMHEYKSGFVDLGIDPDNTTKDEIDQIISTITTFTEAIDILYDTADAYTLRECIDLYASEKRSNTKLQEIHKEMSSYIEEKSKLEAELSKTVNDMNIVSLLDSRPKKCKIDSCYFLTEAFDIIGNYGSISNIETKIQDLENSITEIDNILKQFQDDMNLYQELASIEPILDKLTTLLDSNQAILSKFPLTLRLLDKKSLYEQISRNYLFNDYRDTLLLQAISNDITMYIHVRDVFWELVAKQTNNIKLNEECESLREERNKLKEETIQKKEERDNLIADNEFVDKLIGELSHKIDVTTTLIEKYNDWVEEDNKCKLLEIEFNKLKDQFKGSADILDRISEAQQELLVAKNELVPIMDQKKTIESQLLLLESYNKEYAEYSEKYVIIDKLKRYASPTGGIQSLFMSLYMSKTLDLANQLLSMIFQGQYRLLDYVINQDEFQMPFVGNGLVVDDISSGSTSQVCIMGMIINLVLLNQASTKYNITRLDEIDGGLDHQNRYMFVDILQKIISILNIEQLFIISHSAESALSNVDIIQLAELEDYEDVFTGGNIIYTYKENI